ncbi:MAG: RNA polymerase sigma factor [Gemmatimonadaceae bacterium]
MPRAAIALDHLHVVSARPTAVRDSLVAEASDEQRLIRSVLAGDPAAGRKLYDAHAPRVYRLAYRLSGDADTARELTQETFIRAFDRLDRFRGEAAFSTWLHQIAVSVTLNGMRKVKRFRVRETDLDDAAHLGVETQAAEPDLRERLNKAIDALPEALRVTLVMHDIEGYTHGEISEILGAPDGTCKSRLAAARARLRIALADFATE